jgi:hypothetical protein
MTAGAESIDQTGFLHQTLDVHLSFFAGLYANISLHRGVGFQRRRIDADKQLAFFEQLLVTDHRQHELEDLLMHLQRQSITNPAQRRKIGWLLVQL